MIRTELNIAANFKNRFPDLSNFQALEIASKIRMNDILKKAFSVPTNLEYPPAIEAVALAVGYDRTNGQSVTKALNAIAESL